MSFLEKRCPPEEAAMPVDFKPKLDKIVELLLYLAHSRPNADKYQAVKFFYLADRRHIQRYGRPITQEAYFALPYGPVASKAMDLLNGDAWTMRDAGIEELPFETEVKEVGGSRLTYIRAPKRPVDFDLFSKSDIRVFDEIIAEYGDKSFKELFDLTHGHFAYRRAWIKRKPGSNRSEMFYEDMIEDQAAKDSFLEDIAPVAAYLE
jgi:uncharacterized phage-associated protein